MKNIEFSIYSKENQHQYVVNGLSKSLRTLKAHLVQHVECGSLVDTNELLPKRVVANEACF